MNLELLSVDPKRITFRPQAGPDRVRLSAFCPHDKSVSLVGRWVEGSFVVEPTPAAGDVVPAAIPPAGSTGTIAPPLNEERSRVAKLSDADLQTMAAERGVAWDKKASRATMVERVSAAMK